MENLVASRDYDPREVDRLDSSFTDLEGFSRRWMTGALNTDDAYYNRGFEKYDVVSPLKKGSISVGDFVSIQNRSAVVKAVHTVADAGLDGDIGGVTVLEDMRYLPKAYRDNPSAYGYESNGKGMTRTYVFGKDTKLSGLRNGGGNVESIPFYGSLMIVKQNTSNPNTWNAIMQAVNRRDNGV